MISRLVPLDSNCWPPIPISRSPIMGNSASAPRYTAPGAVRRLSTWLRCSAVGQPGRMPGTKPPYFLMLSAISAALNVIDT